MTNAEKLRELKLRPTLSQVEKWLRPFTTTFTGEWKSLGEDFAQKVDEMYRSVPRYSREEVESLENLFDLTYPENSIPIPAFDLEAKAMLERREREAMREAMQISMQTDDL